MICIDCPNKCGEYSNNICSDKAYYEWALKAEECERRTPCTESTKCATGASETSGGFMKE